MLWTTVGTRVATHSLFQGIVPYLLLRCCVPYQSCKEHPLFLIFNWLNFYNWNRTQLQKFRLSVAEIKLKEFQISDFVSYDVHSMTDHSLVLVLQCFLLVEWAHEQCELLFGFGSIIFGQDFIRVLKVLDQYYMFIMTEVSPSRA